MSSIRIKQLLILDTAAGSAETDNHASITIGEVPTMKIISDEEQASSDRFSDRSQYEFSDWSSCFGLFEFHMQQFTHMLGHKVIVG